MIRAEIEIAAPPELIRAIVLDFPNLPSWTRDFIKSIESETPGKTTGTDMVPGDRIHSKIAGMDLHQVLEVSRTSP